VLLCLDTGQYLWAYMFMNEKQHLMCVGIPDTNPCWTNHGGF
jgi:hypothetical protein